MKFRQIRQNQGKTIACSTLRLKQGAARCDYRTFFDRMQLHGLIDQNACYEIIAKKPESFDKAHKIANDLEATRFPSIAV